MWINLVFLSVASLCVGFILGWLVARPRRWGVFAADTPRPGEDPSDANNFAHRA